MADVGSEVADMAGELQARAARAVSDYVYGETNNLIADAEKAIHDCRFNEAEEKLEKAGIAAPEECRIYGVKYRLAEVQFSSFIYRNRRVLGVNNALFNPVTAHTQNALQREYPDYESAVGRTRLVIPFTRGWT